MELMFAHGDLQRSCHGVGVKSRVQNQHGTVDAFALKIGGKLLKKDLLVVL